MITESNIEQDSSHLDRNNNLNKSMKSFLINNGVEPISALLQLDTSAIPN